jgi:acyl carrier protein
VDVRTRLVNMLDEVLGLNGRTAYLGDDAPLLGALQELDSMAVVAVIGLMEERFAIHIEDDEIDGRTFATLGTLVHFVREQLRRQAIHQPD